MYTSLSHIYNLETISRLGDLTYSSSDSTYTLELRFVSNYDLVTKIFNELVSISNSTFKIEDLLPPEEVENNKRLACYTYIKITNSSIDGLILKFISKFKKVRYDA